MKMVILLSSLLWFFNHIIVLVEHNSSLQIKYILYQINKFIALKINFRNKINKLWTIGPLLHLFIKNQHLKNL
jgi:hypothetical protein